MAGDQAPEPQGQAYGFEFQAHSE